MTTKKIKRKPTPRNLRATKWIESLRVRGVSIGLDGSINSGDLTDADIKTMLIIGPKCIQRTLKAMRTASRTNVQVAARTPLTPAEYRAAGFIRNELGVWCYPDGDEAGERLIAEIGVEGLRRLADERAAEWRRQAWGLFRRHA